jgi:uncharacterized protein DUF3592
MKRIVMFALAIGKFVVLPIGVLILATAAWMYVDTRAWLGRSVEVEGTIIDMVRAVDRDAVALAPLVRFTTTDGKTIEFQQPRQRSQSGYRTGQTVTVRYDTSDPGRVRSATIVGVYPLWEQSIVMGGIGAVVLLLGTTAVVIARRRVRCGTTARVYETSLPRVALGLAAGAIVGAALTMPLGFDDIGDLQDLPGLKAALVIFAGLAALWAAGLVLFASLPWLILHRKGKRSWGNAVALGTVLTFMVTLGLLTQAFARSDGGPGTIDGRLAFALFCGLVGAIVGAVVWRTAYRRAA